MGLVEMGLSGNGQGSRGTAAFSHCLSSTATCRFRTPPNGPHPPSLPPSLPTLTNKLTLSLHSLAPIHMLHTTAAMHMHLRTRKCTHTHARACVRSCACTRTRARTHSCVTGARARSRCAIGRAGSSACCRKSRSASRSSSVSETQSPPRPFLLPRVCLPAAACCFVRAGLRRIAVSPVARHGRAAAPRMPRVALTRLWGGTGPAVGWHWPGCGVALARLWVALACRGVGVGLLCRDGPDRSACR